MRVVPPVEEKARAAAVAEGAPEKAAREPWGWNRRQRWVMGGLVSFLLAMLLVQWVRRPARWDDPVVVVNGAAVGLPERVDPNVAGVRELALIPHIGDATAGKIVAYREARRAAAVDGIVFHRMEDLDAVPGLGKKMIEEVAAYLRFPGDE